jgi:hypothetical protein
MNPEPMTPGGVLRALAAAVDTNPDRWPGRDQWTPGADVDGLRDGGWAYVLPAAWATLTGRPGGDVLAVLHGRGALAVPESKRRKSEWTAPGPRWAGKPAAYKVSLAALADPPPDVDTLPAVTAPPTSTAPASPGPPDPDPFWDAITTDRETATWAAINGVREPADPQDGGRDCPDCGAPTHWAGGYTALVCTRGKRIRIGRDRLAADRAARYADRTRRAIPAGPSALELAETAEDAAVIADRLRGMRELLDKIPRGHPSRAAAVRGIVRIDRLAERCQAARTAVDVDSAEDDADILAAAMAGLIQTARKLARGPESADPARPAGHPLLRFFRGHDGAYGYDDDGQDVEPDDDDGQDDDDDAEELADVQPAPPGNLPLCGPCWRQGQSTPAVVRLDPHHRDGQHGIDVCAAHLPGFGPGPQIIIDYRLGRPMLPPPRFPLPAARRPPERHLIMIGPNTAVIRQ